MTTLKVVLATFAATLIVLILFGGKTPASALDLTIRYAPPQLFSPGSTASINHVPEPLGVVEQEARDAAISRWTEYCKPARRADALGVVHLTYAHPGCEFGEGE